MKNDRAGGAAWKRLGGSGSLVLVVTCSVGSEVANERWRSDFQEPRKEISWQSDGQSRRDRGERIFRINVRDASEQTRKRGNPRPVGSGGTVGRDRTRSNAWNLPREAQKTPSIMNCDEHIRRYHAAERRRED